MTLLELVTGGNGFIGSNLVIRLVNSGRRVISILPPWEKLNTSLISEIKDIVRISGLSDMAEFINSGYSVFVIGDITDKDFVDKFFKTVYESGCSFDNIFHLAACSTVQSAANDEALAWRTNFDGTRHILDAVKTYCKNDEASYSLKSFVYASTDKIYGEGSSLPYDEDDPVAPVFIYDKTKAAADTMVRDYHNTYKLPAAVLRFCNVYGPGDLHKTRLIPGTLYNILVAGQPPVLKMYNGERGAILSFKRDLIYVGDIIEALLKASEKAGSSDDTVKTSVQGQAFNIGTENCYSVEDTIMLIQRILGDGKSPDILISEGELREQCMSYQKANRILGFSPTVSLADGLRRTISWFGREGVCFEWID